MGINYNQDIDHVLLSEEDIKNKVIELSKQISTDYRDKNLLLVSILKGAVMFLSDLSRAITIPHRFDFMSVSSYGSRTISSGNVKIIKDLDQNLEDLDVLIIEDILDSGLSLSYIMELLQTRNPKSVKICTLLNKPAKRKANIQVDYCGFNIPDVFVVGYGLDFAEYYRSLPYIGVLKKEKYR